MKEDKKYLALGLALGLAILGCLAAVSPGGGGGGGANTNSVWGRITGTITNQNDLVAYVMAQAGGGGGDTIWTNFSLLDAEGGTINGSYILNPQTNGGIIIATCFLTNFAGNFDTSVSIGYPMVDIAARQASENTVLFYVGGYQGEDYLTNTYSLFNFGLSSGLAAYHNNSYDIFNLGYIAGANATNYNSFELYNLVSGAGNSAVNSNANTVINIQGGNALLVYDSSVIFNLFGGNNGLVDSSSSAIMNFGENGSHSYQHGVSEAVNFGFQNGQQITNLLGSIIYNYGHHSGANLVIDNSSDLFNYGNGAGYASNATNSTGIYNYETHSGLSSTYTNAAHISNRGFGAGSGVTIIDSSDIISDGKDAGANLTLNGKSHIFMLGSGSKATNSNDFVVGDNTYNYFFPGASMRVEGPVSTGNSIQTGDPGSGTATWKMGKVLTGLTLNLVITNAVEVNIGGTVVKLAIVK